MIRRVDVDGYKSLKKVSLPLDRLTIVLGPNAAGKSNLFDALRLLSRMVTSRSLDEAFRGHRGDPLEAFDCSEGGIAGLLKKEEARFTIGVDVELDDSIVSFTERMIQQHRSWNTNDDSSKKGHIRKVTERFLRYRVTIAIMPREGILRVVDEYLGALKEKNGELRPDERRKPFLERIHDRLRLRMEGQARPTEYELGLNYTIASQPVYPPHYPHLIAFREEVSRWQFYYLEPHLMREENPVMETEMLTELGGNLAAFYYTLQRKNPRQFENIQKTLQMLIPNMSEFSPELTEEGKVRLRISEYGVDFSAKIISEGTLRLLALIAIVSSTNPATVVCFEEPENGVHPRRMKLIADLLRNASEKKQIIVNTHSPILPDYLQDAYLVQCTKKDKHSYFQPLSNAIGLFRSSTVAEALQEKIPLSQRILRGDWE